MGNVSTFELMLSLGFRTGKDRSDVCSFDFGNFELSACSGLNAYAQPTVLLMDILPSHGCALNYELPETMDSLEQGMAWIAHYLDKKFLGKFEPAYPVDWLDEGRLNQHLLPWEIERAAYKARPCCRVGREWAKVGLRTLAKVLSNTPSMERVVFSFDGEILQIRAGRELMAMPGKGTPWPEKYAIRAYKIGGHILRRLARDPVEFSVWKDALTIGSYRYDGITPVAERGNPQLSLFDPAGE